MDRIPDANSYILNRGWIDKSGSHVPTYDEVVADEEVKGEPSRPRRPAGVSDEQPWGVLDEDEFDDKADEFEAQYNFRFEEPYVCLYTLCKTR